MKKVLIAVVAVAVLALAAWLLLSRGNLIPQSGRQEPTQEVPANDNSASIKKDIEGLEVNSPDGEFKAIDADINQL